MDLLKVVRFIFKNDWTLSKVYINNILDGYAVEDEIREVKVKGETAIPLGNYELGFRQSPKFSSSYLYSDYSNMLIYPKDINNYPSIKDWRPHDLIWVKNIPGFEYVLIHWGNTDDDTDGCLIIGKSIGVINGKEGVVNSRTYYKSFYEKVYPLIREGGKTISYINEELFA